MSSKALVTLAALVFSISSAAQVQHAGRQTPSKFSVGAGMDYWSGDWGTGGINRWGPAGWATLEVWRGLGINAEVHSMIAGGNDLASGYKYVAGEGGAIYMYRHWNTLQPFAKGELGFGSLTHPDNGTGQLHLTSNTWAVGGGLEVHTWRRLWTRVDYTCDFIPHFHSSITGQYHALNPRGLTFGETFRF